MARLQKRSLSQPDEVRPVGRGRLEVVEIGDAAFGRIVYEPGWRWTTDVRPIVGTELCEIHHMGYVIAGKLHLEMRDGSSLEAETGDIFECPPGHDAWVIGDEPWISIDWAGRRHYARPRDASAERRLATILFTDLVEFDRGSRRSSGTAIGSTASPITTARYCAGSSAITVARSTPPATVYWRYSTARRTPSTARST